MGEKVEYTIELIKEEEKGEIYEFMKEYFTKDEPICSYLGLLHCEEIERFLIGSLSYNCSYKAVTKNGEIIGAILNGIKHRPPPDDAPKQKAVDQAKDEKWKKFCYLIDELVENYNIFVDYPDCDVFVDGKALAVNRKYRGNGIAEELVRKAAQYMREHKIPAMKRICSSAFSARIMEKLNMKEVYRVVYEDFKVNGVQMFKPVSPHVACRVFVMEK